VFGRKLIRGMSSVTNIDIVNDVVGDRRPKAGQPDAQCNYGRTIRTAAYASISQYSYARTDYTRSHENHVLSYTINVTTSGAWEFHGVDGQTLISKGMVTVSVPGDIYGCAHSRPHSNVLITLDESAIDPEIGTLFDERILRFPNLAPVLERALSSETEDEFDSRVFEVFDWVSARSFKERPRPGIRSLRMQRVKRFIERHALEDISLTDIATDVGLTPFVCLRQFKQATGTTPYAYLLKCRGAEARRLLRSNTVGLEEIAKKTGFKDPSHFCRFFKRAMGLTPTEYRNQDSCI
jgi:AraC-like DNA-binding protein